MYALTNCRIHTASECLEAHAVVIDGRHIVDIVEAENIPADIGKEFARTLRGLDGNLLVESRLVGKNAQERSRQVCGNTKFLQFKFEIPRLYLKLLVDDPEGLVDFLQKRVGSGSKFIAPGFLLDGCKLGGTEAGPEDAPPGKLVPCSPQRIAPGSANAFHSGLREPPKARTHLSPEVREVA